MAAPVVSPVRGCGPDSGERGPSAGKLMSLSHSLAADVLSRTSSNMLNNATESSRACGRAGVIPPFLWFRARPKPHDPAFLIRQRWRSFRSVLTGTRRRKTPFSGWSRSMSNPASRSNSPRWIRRRTPSWPGASAFIRTATDPRLVCPPARQDLRARRLRRIHILVRPTDAAILGGRNGTGPDGRRSVQRSIRRLEEPDIAGAFYE